MEVILGGLEFYRLCTRLKENELFQIRMQDALRAKLSAALKEAGLDPAKTYRLDEKTLTATEVDPNAV